MIKRQKKLKQLPYKRPRIFKLSDSKIFTILFLVYLVLILLQYDPKLFLGGDNAHYIILTKSLLQGTGYRDIFAPDSPPHTLYPPGFPLILIPGIILFNNNFALLNFVIIGLSLGAFLLFYKMLKGMNLRQYWIFSLTIFAVSPLLIEYSHLILSEIPYLFFSLLAFYLFNRYGILKKNNVGFFILMGLSVAFVYFIRSIGICLILACLVYLILKRRWLEFLGLFIIIVVILISWQIYNVSINAPSGGYLKPFLLRNPYEPESGNINISNLSARFFDNFKLYAFFVIPQILFPSITSSWLLNTLGFFAFVLIVIGLIIIIKTKSLEVGELYFIFFMAITLSWPQVWSGDRFLIPVIPFLLYYFFIGLSNFSHWLKFKSLTWIIAFLMIILALIDSAKKIPSNISNLVAYLKGNKYAGYPIDWQRYFETLNWIKDNTEKDAIVVSRKPQFTYLLSERKSFLYQLSSDPEKIINDFYEKKANYLLFDSFYWTGTTRKYIGPVLQRYPDKFELVYKSPPPEMYVFKIK